jgi:hypothetical protein|tara:strand:+ start:386 stop:652 length:267 start_codon:yes stop_codon:yes gene_type:complete
LNYEIWLSGNGGDISDSKLFTIFLEEWARPTRGQQMKIKGTLFEVDRTDPSDNPTGQMVKIFVSQYNPNKPFSRSVRIGRRMRDAVRY